MQKEIQKSFISQKFDFFKLKDPHTENKEKMLFGHSILENACFKLYNLSLLFILAPSLFITYFYLTGFIHTADFSKVANFFSGDDFKAATGSNFLLILFLTDILVNFLKWFICPEGKKNKLYPRILMSFGATYLGYNVISTFWSNLISMV